jgi:membrane protein implicated in regulation of membrane protease activity
MAREGSSGRRGFAAARAVKAVVAGAMVAAVAVALGTFALYRVGLGAYADPLLADRFPLAFVVLTALSAALLYRRFDR